MRTKFGSFAVVVLMLVLGSASSLVAAVGPYAVQPTQLAQEVLQAVAENFRSAKALGDLSLLSPSASIDIERETSIALAFVGESAGYKNSVGFFRMAADGSVLSETVAFANFSGTGTGLAGGGTLNPGDTVEIGTFLPGERVGFFVAANGFSDAKAPKWYTDSKLNSDGQDHDAVLQLDGFGTLIGFEDLKGLGDRDYDDALLLVSIEVAPEPVVEPTDEPVVEPSDEPVVEPTDEPVVEPSDEPVVEPSDEPVVEPAQQSLEERVSQMTGISVGAAHDITQEFGTASVERALCATDAEGFWTRLQGYTVSMGGGGGGFDLGGVQGDVVRMEFQLISPLTGEPVGDSPVSLTIVQAPSNNIVDVLVVEFDPSSSSYRYELNTSDLAGGAYDLYLGLSETGQSHMMQIHVLADSE